MEQKTAFYKRKAVVIPAVLLLLATVVTAVVLFATVHVDVTVGEALSTTTTDVSVSGFPGEVLTQSIDINNKASVPLNISVTFLETENPDGVTYTTNMPFVKTLEPGNNTIDTAFTINHDSPIGSFNGTIELTRI